MEPYNSTLKWWVSSLCCIKTIASSYMWLLDISVIAFLFYLILILEAL